MNREMLYFPDQETPGLSATIEYRLKGLILINSSCLCGFDNIQVGREDYFQV